MILRWSCRTRLLTLWLWAVAVRANVAAAEDESLLLSDYHVLHDRSVDHLAASLFEDLAPTLEPTVKPTVKPTEAPTVALTATPSFVRTLLPTAAPLLT